MKNYYLFALIIFFSSNTSNAFLTQCQHYSALGEKYLSLCPSVWALGFKPPIYYNGDSFNNTNTGLLSSTANGTDQVTGVETELTNAINDWNNQTSSFKFTYNGRTSETVSSAVPPVGDFNHLGKVMIGARDFSLSGDCANMPGFTTYGCTASFGSVKLPFPGNPTVFLQGIKTNCAVTFSTNDIPSISTFRQTLRHELGHCLGLDHTKDTSNAVMCTGDPNDSPQGCSFPPAIQADDTNGVQYLYGGGTYSVADNNPSLSLNSDGLPAARSISPPFTTAANVKVTLQGLRTNLGAQFYSDIDSQTIVVKAGQRLGLFVDWIDLSTINPLFYQASLSIYIIQEDGTTINMGSVASNVSSCTINSTGQSCIIVNYQMFGARVIGEIVSP